MENDVESCKHALILSWKYPDNIIKDMEDPFMKYLYVYKNEYNKYDKTMYGKKLCQLEHSREIPVHCRIP